MIEQILVSLTKEEAQVLIKICHRIKDASRKGYIRAAIPLDDRTVNRSYDARWKLVKAIENTEIANNGCCH